MPHKICASRLHRNSVASKSKGRNFAENPVPLSTHPYLARIIAKLGYRYAVRNGPT